MGQLPVDKAGADFVGRGSKKALCRVQECGTIQAAQQAVPACRPRWVGMAQEQQDSAWIGTNGQPGPACRLACQRQESVGAGTEPGQLRSRFARCQDAHLDRSFDQEGRWRPAAFAEPPAVLDL